MSQFKLCKCYANMSYGVYQENIVIYYSVLRVIIWQSLCYVFGLNIIAGYDIYTLTYFFKDTDALVHMYDLYISSNLDNHILIGGSIYWIM